MAARLKASKEVKRITEERNAAMLEIKWVTRGGGGGGRDGGRNRGIKCSSVISCV